MSELAYPFNDGDALVLGPEVIATEDRKLICWEGEQYVPAQVAEDRLAALLFGLARDELPFGEIERRIETVDFDGVPSPSRPLGAWAHSAARRVIR